MYIINTNFIVVDTIMCMYNATIHAVLRKRFQIHAVISKFIIIHDVLCTVV